jgi:hypothetical protein
MATIIHIRDTGDEASGNLRAADRSDEWLISLDRLPERLVMEEIRPPDGSTGPNG